MTSTISATQFKERDGLDDWRYLLGRIEAMFVASSYEAAATLALRIAEAAEAAEHHPDIDIRYLGRVHVALTTHAAGGRVTEADLSLAATISQLAADAGTTSEPLSTRSSEVAIDAMDIGAVLPFWRAVLGYVDDAAQDELGSDAIVDPLRIGPAFWFQQMDEPRPQRNRIHIDVTVPHDIAEQRVADAIAAGGHLVNDGAARAFWVLADAEGNEACVCTWQDRD